MYVRCSAGAGGCATEVEGGNGEDWAAMQCNIRAWWLQYSTADAIEACGRADGGAMQLKLTVVSAREISESFGARPLVWASAALGAVPLP